MKGYKLKDKIIKYSKVIVCKNNWISKRIIFKHLNF
jgi:hypothetical protein